MSTNDMRVSDTYPDGTTGWTVGVENQNGVDRAFALYAICVAA